MAILHNCYMLRTMQVHVNCAQCLPEWVFITCASPLVCHSQIWNSANLINAHTKAKMQNDGAIAWKQVRCAKQNNKKIQNSSNKSWRSTLAPRKDDRFVRGVQLIWNLKCLLLLVGSWRLSGSRWTWTSTLIPCCHLFGMMMSPASLTDRLLFYIDGMYRNIHTCCFFWFF